MIFANNIRSPLFNVWSSFCSTGKRSRLNALKCLHQPEAPPGRRRSFLRVQWPAATAIAETLKTPKTEDRLPASPSKMKHARGFRLCRNPRAPPEPTPPVGSGFAGTHAPCRNPRCAWVPALPEPTRRAGTHRGRGFRPCRNPRAVPEPIAGVGSGVPYVGSVASSEPTYVGSFIFEGDAGRRSSVFGVLGVSPSLLLLHAHAELGAQPVETIMRACKQSRHVRRGKRHQTLFWCHR